MQHCRKSELPVKYESDFLQKMDRRFGHVKALRQAYDELIADTGAESHVKRSLCERYVWLEFVLRSLERRFLEATEEEAAELLSRWIQGSNAALGYARLLGLTRKAKGIQSLEAYVRAKDSRP